MAGKSIASFFRKRVCDQGDSEQSQNSVTVTAPVAPSVAGVAIEAEVVVLNHETEMVMNDDHDVTATPPSK